MTNIIQIGQICLPFNRGILFGRNIKYYLCTMLLNKFYLIFTFIILSLPSMGQKLMLGYLPLFKPQEIKNVEFDGLTHVLLAFGNPDSSGKLHFASSIDSILPRIKQSNKKVLVSLGGGGSYSFGKAHKYYLYLTSDKKRKSFINSLVSYALEKDLDGYDLNLEGRALMIPNYEKFVVELKAKCEHSNLMLIGTYFTRSKMWVSKRVLDNLDYVQVMSYSGVGIQNIHKPHNVNIPKYYQTNWDYWRTQTDTDKIIMGIPLYAPLFPKKGVNLNLLDAFLTYREVDSINSVSVLKSEKDFVVVDDVGVAYFNNKKQLDEKIQISKNAAGYMFWEITQDSKKNSVISYFCDYFR